MGERTGRIEDRWFLIGGRRIRATVSVEPVPPGRLPVVLVHGLAVSSRYMLPTAKHLAPEYQVYAPDLPGFGASDKPAHVLTIGELADTVAAFMQTVGVTRANLIGNSLGCQIIVEFALRYPGCIERGVLIGPTMDRYARSMLRQFVRLVRDSLHEPLDQPFVVLRDYLRTGVRRTLRTLKYGLEDRIEEKLPRVQAPMLVVRGGKDPIVSQRWSEEVASLLPNGRLIVVPDAAHTVNYSAPEELKRIVLPFFESA